MAQAVGPSTGQLISKPLKKCVQCEATDKKLSRCARCLIVTYCSQECQKAHWPTHKKVCRESPQAKAVLDAVLERKIVNAASLPYGRKDFAIDEIARELVKNEQDKLAFQIVKQHVSLYPVIIKFFEYAAGYILKDTRRISQLETFGQELKIEAKQIRQKVVEALATSGHIKEACAKARSTEFSEQSFLLEIVASALINKKQYKEAKEIALTIPDTGRRKDLLQMLPT